MAENLHMQTRVGFNILGDDARDRKRTLQQENRGSRHCFGDAACPRLDDQVKPWPLPAPERIGVTLSEEFQLHPEQSKTALITHHPQTTYFNVR